MKQSRIVTDAKEYIFWDGYYASFGYVLDLVISIPNGLYVTWVRNEDTSDGSI